MLRIETQDSNEIKENKHQLIYDLVLLKESPYETQKYISIHGGLKIYF